MIGRVSCAAMTPGISVENLSVKLGGADVLTNCSLVVPSGTVTALLGPSGCGKTTLLRAVAGLIHPSAGEIQIGTDVVSRPGTAVPPEKRRVGMVFQDGALFDHMTVAGNVAFGLPRRERSGPKVAEALELVGIGSLADRMPATLSGGQAQRVALARAVAPQPAALLLDEPFSHLDANLRREIRDEIHQLLTTIGMTTIVVTHDREEAFILGRQVAVMASGAVLQVDTPEMIYSRPATAWIARFVGDTNIVDAYRTDGGTTCALGQIGTTPIIDGPQQVAMRPEQIEVRAAQGQGSTEPGWAPAVVAERYFIGPVVRLGIEMREPSQLGDKVRIVVALPHIGLSSSSKPGLECFAPGTAVEVRPRSTTFPAYPT